VEGEEVGRRGVNDWLLRRWMWGSKQDRFIECGEGSSDGVVSDRDSHAQPCHLTRGGAQLRGVVGLQHALQLEREEEGLSHRHLPQPQHQRHPSLRTPGYPAHPRAPLRITLHVQCELLLGLLRRAASGYEVIQGRCNLGLGDARANGSGTVVWEQRK